MFSDYSAFHLPSEMPVSKRAVKKNAKGKNFIVCFVSVRCGSSEMCSLGDLSGLVLVTISQLFLQSELTTLLYCRSLKGRQFMALHSFPFISSKRELL